MDEAPMLSTSAADYSGTDSSLERRVPTMGTLGDPARQEYVSGQVRHVSASATEVSEATGGTKRKKGAGRGHNCQGRETSD
eukprot:4033608-Karenia_brevis.AAC.1